MAPKRKLDAAGPESSKRMKITPTTASSSPNVVKITANPASTSDSASTAPQSHDKGMAAAATSNDAPKKHRINKLVPPRPYPTVPTSVSATGPRSAHKEGKNMICITRKTKLGAYMRRCKDMIIKDG